MAELDRVAEALAELRDNGVVVLWRPFHEMTGDWFWWCTKAHPGNPEPFKKMWIHMFDYFTKTKKLDNLLWVYSASNRRDPPPDYCYPGDSYVDIVGQDIYSDSAEVSGYENLLALGKPFCLSEFGKTIKNKDRPFDYLVLIEKIKHKYPDTIYWLSWDGPYSIARNLNAEALLNDPWVITRDELDWK